MFTNEKRVAGSSPATRSTIFAAKQTSLRAHYRGKSRAVQGDPWRTLFNYWPRSPKVSSDWQWPAQAEEIRPVAPPDPDPRVTPAERRLVHGTLVTKPRRFWDFCSRPAALVDIAVDGSQFRAIARGEPARALLTVPAGADITVVISGSETTWAVAGVIQGEPPAFPFFAIVSGSYQGFVVYLFDNNGPPLFIRPWRDRERAKRFAMGLAARAAWEYQMEVVDFTTLQGDMARVE
jgi:hypothetical protein